MEGTLLRVSYVRAYFFSPLEFYMWLHAFSYSSSFSERSVTLVAAILARII